MVVYVIVVLQVRTSTNMVEVNQYLQDPSLQAVLEAQGHALQAQSLNAKDKFVDVITQHVLVDSTRYLLEELKEGLAVMGVLQKIKEHPLQFAEIFCYQKTELDAQIIDAMFRISYAERGTNARPRQERAVTYWRDYIQDCAGMLNSYTLCTFRSK